MTDDVERAVRRQAAVALGLIGPAAKHAVPALTKVLKDRKDPYMTPFVAFALGRIGPAAAKEAVTPLSEVLKQSNDPRACGGGLGARRDGCGSQSGRR